jgi:uncharacterized protein YkwD
VIVSIIFYFKSDIFIPIFETRLKTAQSVVKDKIIQISKEISTPGPLFGNLKSSNTILTKEGILMWTNIQRKQNSQFESLNSNSDLDKIAQLRLEDMFSKQYFEHVSPTGESASDVADSVGYEYIAIGENIALGNFGNDELIVQAWMNSPGHRENILNKKYKEIGIAAKKGLYDGDEIWIAVQIFGRPFSDCVEPSSLTKLEVEKSQNDLESLKKEATKMYGDLMILKNNTNSTEYNVKVDEYNIIVKKVNEKITETKNLIMKYNIQVKAFNICLEN